MLLVVVGIMLLLMLKFMGGGDGPQKEVSSAVTNIEHSADIACTSNRNVIKADLTMWQVNNPGEPMKLDEIRAKLNLPTCPRGGAYLLGPDGAVYCTKHFPPSAALMQQVMALNTPVPTSTPFGTPPPLGGGKP